MSIKIEALSAINSTPWNSPDEETVTDLNARIKRNINEGGDEPEIDWKNEALKIMMKQFSDAMYDPENEIYIGDRDIF